MKAIILFFFFAYTSLTAQVTQEWIATYNGIGTGGNYADKAAVDNFGNFIVAGRSDSISTDYIILKYNSSGNLLWSRRHDGVAHNDERLRGMILDDSGNIYITGTSFEGAANGNINWLTIKYNPAGELLWKKSLDWTLHKEDVPFSITLDKLNNVYVAGYGWAPPAPYENFDMVVAKYNGITGDVIYTQSYNSFEYIADWGYSVVTDDSCNAYVSGYAKLQSNPSLDVIATVKYDSEGNQVWLREFLRANPEYAIPMYSKIDKSNNVIISGFYGAGDNYVTLKYNSDGNLLWNNIYYGTGGLNIIHDIYIDDSLNTFIAGRSFTNQWNDVLVIKYNASGNTQWVKLYDSGTNLIDEAFAIIGDNLGNIYRTGRTTLIGSDFLTLKYDLNGNLKWTKIYSSPMTNIAYAVGLDMYNNVFIAGYKDSASRSSIVAIKYSQLTNIPNENSGIIKSYSLSNFPNPFNPETTIKYEIPDNANIKIIVYDVIGKKIYESINQNQSKGKNQIIFNGSQYSSGIYFYSLTVNNKLVKINKMLLIK